MFKLSPRRNQRSKGFKVKHALQLILLAGVCIWLVYQVQHSSNKKASFERGTKISEKVSNGNEFLKLGRKDLNPRVEEKTIDDQKHEEEEKEEEIKHFPEEIKPEEDEGEGKQGALDEIHEHDQEKRRWKRGKRMS
ncbi:hypothetical protein CsSME_00005494 [Camellia sinensis var. sinensis]